MLPLIAVLAAATPAEAPTADQERGLWAGPMHLCRETVAKATLHSTLLDGDSVLIELTPEARDRFGRMTFERLGETLPIRLDGRTILEPVVNVPMDLGVLFLSLAWGSDVRDSTPIRDAALGPC